MTKAVLTIEVELPLGYPISMTPDGIPCPRPLDMDLLTQRMWELGVSAPGLWIRWDISEGTP